MSTQSNRNKYEPIGDKYDLAKVDLYELHERLWYEYYTPVEPHTKEVAKFIREQLNIVGECINEQAISKEHEVQIVKASDKFTPTPHDEGASKWKGGCIYAVTQVLYVPPKSKKKTQPKVEVIEDDLMGGDDDLMGEDKPKKGKSKEAPKKSVPKKSTGGKSNYDIIADLAAQGKTKDEIVELTDFSRKTVTDNLWRYNQKNPTKKKK